MSVRLPAMYVSAARRHSDIMITTIAMSFQLHQSTPLRKWQRMLCLLIGIIDEPCPYGNGTLQHRYRVKILFNVILVIKANKSQTNIIYANETH